jgi:hypothetical protein
MGIISSFFMPHGVIVTLMIIMVVVMIMVMAILSCLLLFTFL